MAKVLVANGANVNAENANAETPLIIAERYGYVELANFLLVRFSEKVIKIGPIHIILQLNQIFILINCSRRYLFEQIQFKANYAITLVRNVFNYSAPRITHRPKADL